MTHITISTDSFHLDGQPLPLVTEDGFRKWIEGGKTVTPIYDVINRSETGSATYRCLLRPMGDAQTYLLVELPERSDRIDPVLLIGDLDVHAHRKMLARLANDA